MTFAFDGMLTSDRLPIWVMRLPSMSIAPSSIVPASLIVTSLAPTSAMDVFGLAYLVWKPIDCSLMASSGGMVSPSFRKA